MHDEGASLRKRTDSDSAEATIFFPLSTSRTQVDMAISGDSFWLDVQFVGTKVRTSELLQLGD